MKFKNLKLKTKQFLAFGLILLVMMAALSFMWQRVELLKGEVDVLSTNWLPRVVAASEINLNTAKLRLTQMQQVNADDPDERDRLSELMSAAIDDINANIDKYRALCEISDSLRLYSQEEQAHYRRFDQSWERYVDYSFEVLNFMIEGDQTAANDLLNGEAQVMFDALRNDLQQLVEVINQGSFAAAARADETLRLTRKGSFMSLLVATVLSVAITLVLVRYLTVPMSKLVDAAGQVASGDLSAQVEMDSKDEVGNLADSFNKMTAALRAAHVKTEEQSQRLRQQAAELQAKNEELEDLLEQLRQSQEQLLMKEKMASLGRLVAGVAHEINNPIGAVNSSVDVSRRCLNKIAQALERCATVAELRADTGFENALRILSDNVRTMATAGDRIATIVKSLRSFSQLDEADYQRIDIHEGIESSLTLLGSKVLGSIDIVREYGDLPTVGCYPAQLNQVWLNLLRNAAEAIADRGRISISSRQEGELVQVTIIDNGRGISADQLENIFDFRFTTADSRVKMGSGLSVAYNVMQKHKGDIKIISRPPAGATVTVTLPVS